MNLLDDGRSNAKLPLTLLAASSAPLLFRRKPEIEERNSEQLYTSHPSGPPWKIAKRLETKPDQKIVCST